MITRHDDVVWMVRNHETFSSSVIRNDKRPPYPPVEEGDVGLMDGVRAFRADQLVEQDRPQRLAMRHVVREYFTPGAMEKWRPFVRAAVAELLDSAASDLALESAGAFAIVLELMPSAVAERVTQSVKIPTVGIGAGAECDGQVLVLHDLLGPNEGFHPKFLKKYAELGEQVLSALRYYASEVRSGLFPDGLHAHD